MLIKSTAAFQRVTAAIIVESCTALDLDNFGSFRGDQKTGEGGFLKLFQGIKPDIPNHIQRTLKIVINGQAVYEILQNVVDCGSHDFCLYLTGNYLSLTANQTNSSQITNQSIRHLWIQ